MSDFTKLQPGVLEGVVQSLLEARRMARSIESILEGIAPLTDLEPSGLPISESDPRAMIQNMREAAAKLGHDLRTLYERNARQALSAKE